MLPNHSLPLPFIGPITVPTLPEISLEDTEIPVKLELRFAIESRRFANGLDIPEIDLTPGVKDEVIFLLIIFIPNGKLHITKWETYGEIDSYHSLLCQWFLQLTITLSVRVLPTFRMPDIKQSINIKSWTISFDFAALKQLFPRARQQFGALPIGCFKPIGCSRVLSEEEHAVQPIKNGVISKLCYIIAMKLTLACAVRNNVCPSCVTIKNFTLTFLCYEYCFFFLCFFAWKLQLDEEQLERRKVRRERNKVAASKCRQKRKEQASELEKVIIDYCWMKIVYWLSSIDLTTINYWLLIISSVFRGGMRSCISALKMQEMPFQKPKTFWGGGAYPRTPLKLCRHYGLPLTKILATPLLIIQFNVIRRFMRELNSFMRNSIKFFFFMFLF